MRNVSLIIPCLAMMAMRHTSSSYRNRNDDGSDNWLRAKPNLKLSIKQSSIKSLIIISIMPFVASCSSPDSSVVGEAKRAEKEGRIIDNDMMLEQYPKSFRKGHPVYLERDFEAGVNFMCDEFRAQYGKDVCAEPEIHWRR